MNNTKAKVSIAAALLTASAAILSFIAKEEGFGPSVVENGVTYYVTYNDPGPTGKPLSICNGHTRGVKPGMKATEEQCKKWLKEDVAIAEADVKRCVKVPLTQGQFDALSSFNYNTGLLCVSQMVRHINAGQCRLAANEFNNSPMLNKDGTMKLYNGKPVMKFTTGGGVPLRGLINRRKKEREMFEKDCK